jgi:hypothetical protein
MVITHRRVTCDGNRTRLTVCFGQTSFDRIFLQGDFLTDQELWQRAVSIARVEYENLSDLVKAQVLGIGEAIRQNKLEMYSLAGGAAVVETCADCGGLCCEKGKYHFSAIDLLMYLSTGKELFTPSFRRTPCPFLGEEGCLMAPAYRPFTCITFHCERLEEFIPSADLERMCHLERSLRVLCRQMEELFGNRLMQGLLLSCARYLHGDDTGALMLLRRTHGNYDS